MCARGDCEFVFLLETFFIFTYMLDISKIIKFYFSIYSMNNENRHFTNLVDVNVIIKKEVLMI